MKLPQFMIEALIRRAKKTPYDHIGDYMERYWVVKPDSLLGRWFTARIHVIHRSDVDRHLHDHPWSFTTFILKGRYVEVTHHDNIVDAMNWRQFRGVDEGRESSMIRHEGMSKWEVRIEYRAGSVIHRPANSPHRLELVEGESATTLFLMGDYVHKWGFYTPEGKIYWRDYLDKNDVTRRAEVIDQHYGVDKSETIPS